ncbi:DUF1285 domain-containing protein [Halomonas shantousis]
MSLEPLMAHVDPDGAIPPVDRWDPPHCGDMDLVIAADGRWIHEGTPIGRPRLVRLLSTVLRREPDGDYCLVTPVEKVRIQVEDCAFLIIDAELLGDEWQLTTNVGDRITLGEEHRLEVTMTPSGEPVPEVMIRFGLTARLNRNVYYRLIDVAETREVQGQQEIGLVSGGVWQPLGSLPASAE